MLLSAAHSSTSELQLTDKCQFSHDGGRDTGLDRCLTKLFLMYALRLVICPDGCHSLSTSRQFFDVLVFEQVDDLRFSAQKETVF